MRGAVKWASRQMSRDNKKERVWVTGRGKISSGRCEVRDIEEKEKLE